MITKSRFLYLFQALSRPFGCIIADNTFLACLQNVKAYLRRGTAREMLGYYKEAMDGESIYWLFWKMLFDISMPRKLCELWSARLLFLKGSGQTGKNNPTIFDISHLTQTFFFGL